MRLERLRGFGGSFGRAVTCLCARVAQDNGRAVFLVATEPVGPSLPLRERVSRLFANTGKPLLAFTPDGRLLYATAPAQARFAAIQSASGLGAALFNQALIAGCASESGSQLESQAKISKADAQTAALAKVPGGNVKECELEKEKGKLIWSVALATPGTKEITEVNIDAVTGEVVNVEHEKAEK